jgi:hypothetical protein
VEDRQGLRAQELQALEPRPAPVQVVHVGQHGGVGVARFDRHQGGLAQAVQAPGESPDLDDRHHPDVAAGLQDRAVTLGGLQDVQVGPIGGPERRGGDAEAADGADLLHVALHLLHAPGPPRVVVHGPLGESDGVGDRQAEVGDLRLQIRQTPAPRDVGIQLA